MAVGEETDHSICRRSEMATAGVSCIQRAARTARDNAVSALQIASAVRAQGSQLELLALASPKRLSA